MRLYESLNKRHLTTQHMPNTSACYALWAVLAHNRPIAHDMP